MQRTFFPSDFIESSDLFNTQIILHKSKFSNNQEIGLWGLTCNVVLRFLQQKVSDCSMYHYKSRYFVQKLSRESCAQIVCTDGIYTSTAYTNITRSLPRVVLRDSDKSDVLPAAPSRRVSRFVYHLSSYSSAVIFLPMQNAWDAGECGQRVGRRFSFSRTPPCSVPIATSNFRMYIRSLGSTREIL